MLAQQDLLGRIVALLRAEPPVAQDVDRGGSRAAPAQASSRVRVHVIAIDGDELLLSGNPMSWTGVVRISCLARCDASMAPDEAVGPLVARIYDRLTGDTSLQAAGFQLKPRVRLELDDDELEDRIGSVRLYLTAEWWSAPGSMAVVT